MNLRHLEVFRAVMRHGSLTAAAEALNVSQPAISKVIRHFESQIGYRLFDRIGGRSVPTAEARLLFEDADRILREVDVLRGYSDRIRDKQLGLLRVGATAPPTFALLPHAIKRFRGRNPGTKLVIHTLPVEEIAEHILVGDIDLGLSIGPIDAPQIHSVPIGRTKIVCVVHAEHRFAQMDVISPADLVEETVISFGAQTHAGRLLDAAFSDAGQERDLQIEINLSIAAARLVAARLGVALVDALVPWGNFDNLVVRAFQPEIHLDILLNTNLALPISRFVREFTRDVQAALRSMAP